MQTGPRSFRTTLKSQVVIPSLVVVGGLLVVCACWPAKAGEGFAAMQGWVIAHFDWFYVLSVAAFLAFLIIVATSSFGKIKLGPDDAQPEFSFVSWTAMLFAAGMGIGLMYFGVGEPIQHFLRPPNAAAGTPDAAREAMLMTFFHWGFSAWAVYAVMGLVLAYFGFRYNLPLTFRSGLYPVLRGRINGWMGHTVDAFALIGTVAGIATTLGFGVMQLSAGLHIVGGWETDSDTFRIGLIAVVMVLAGLSAASGLDKGVRILSELNLLLAILLLLFVACAGPTSFLLRALGDNIGNYLSSLIDLSFHTYAYQPPREEGWFASWTILYWAWWVSWSPFVGMFIARISRGRTIRQFVVGVLLVPTTFNLIWMTVFGNSAIWLDTHDATGALAQTAGNVDALLFRFFDYLPLTKLLSIVAILLIAVFFVTSADSGAYVIDTIATRGAANSPVWQRLFWAALLGVTAALLIVAGGLKALQAVTLITALPVTCIMLALCYGLWRGLKADRVHSSQTMAPATSFWTGQHWRLRLSRILKQHTEADARQFIEHTVTPALEQVAAEIRQGNVQAKMQRSLDVAQLSLPAMGQRDFVYGARVVKKAAPAFMPRGAANASEHPDAYEVTTFFADGREGYVISYLLADEIIADVLRQYERYVLLATDRRTELLNKAPGHPGFDDE
ncbi:MAG TPA: BCCT family transporter [Dyella sp.]|uniref:BCCT family transporter n=1 Tax=Dyella sp. TaxID=1869338 RepID=UPI002D789738|nr:BCCT family transporter [Dyella sp.]HET6555553.1 BCCT family transporter [Dyella sp.]